MTRTLLSITIVLLLAGCGRPQEVRSLAESALPIATSLKQSAERLQAQFDYQRSDFAERGNELTSQISLDRGYISQIERDWRLRDTKPALATLALARERDGAILSDPLASLRPATPSVTKVPPHDLGPLGSVIKDIDALKQVRKPSMKELVAFAESVNEELARIEDEKSEEK